MVIDMTLLAAGTAACITDGQAYAAINPLGVEEPLLDHQLSFHYPLRVALFFRR